MTVAVGVEITVVVWHNGQVHELVGNIGQLVLGVGQVLLDRRDVDLGGLLLLELLPDGRGVVH